MYVANICTRCKEWEMIDIVKSSKSIMAAETVQLLQLFSHSCSYMYQ